MENPWRNLPSEPPYVLPVDREAIDRFNQTAKPEHFIHLVHMPEPFLGRPDAPVVLLGLNPGHKADDDEWHANPSFRERSRRNLLHNELAYPFYLLDPAEPAPGHRWWSRKLKEPVAASSLEVVARSVLCVELFPYHSRRFAHASLRVPSQSYSLDLVERAIQRRAMIVLLRSERLWMACVPGLATYDRLHRVKNVQNPAVSRRNLPSAFDELLRQLTSFPAPVGHPHELPNSHVEPANVASAGPRIRAMPQNTIRLLNELTAIGFTDADFQVVHHMPDVTIARHVAYCEKTSEFRAGSRNMRVQERLRHVLKAFREAGGAGPASPEVFRRLAQNACIAIP
jgi:hypothetical protein